MSDLIGLLMLVVIVVLGAMLYMLPTIVAYRRRYVERTRVLLINLLAGWTFIGWIIAMVVAFGANVEDRSV